MAQVVFMMLRWSICYSIFPIVAEGASCKDTTAEGTHQPSTVAASHLPLPVPTIHVEMSESSEQFDAPGYKPEKLHRIDKPPLRTPRVAGSNMLVIHEDTGITYGSPQPVRRQHAAVERTLSADSCMSRSQLTANSCLLSPALSVVSSRGSSEDKRSRTSSLSEQGRLSSTGRRSNECNYMDDFDESSDIDEGIRYVQEICIDQCIEICIAVGHCYMCVVCILIHHTNDKKV